MNHSQQIFFMKWKNAVFKIIWWLLEGFLLMHFMVIQKIFRVWMDSFQISHWKCGLPTTRVMMRVLLNSSDVKQAMFVLLIGCWTNLLLSSQSMFSRSCLCLWLKHIFISPNIVHLNNETKWLNEIVWKRSINRFFFIFFFIFFFGEMIEQIEISYTVFILFVCLFVFI